MSRHLDRLRLLPGLALRQARWALGDRSPLVATLKLTRRCTLSCGHCPWIGPPPGGGPREDLPTEAWQGVISDLARRGVINMVLEGGEPTLRRDLNQLVGWVRGRGCTATIVTNGTRPLGPYLPDRFLVSVDGLEGTHDALRGPGAFAALLEHLPGARAPVVLLISLCVQNRGELRPLLERFDGAVDGFWFSFVYGYQETPEGAARPLDRDQRRRAARELLDLKARYPIINTRAYLARVGHPAPCRPWLLTTITADGREVPGCMVQALEPCRCEACDLACHRELTNMLDLSAVGDHLRSFLGRPWR